MSNSGAVRARLREALAHARETRAVARELDGARLEGRHVVHQQLVGQTQRVQQAGADAARKRRAAARQHRQPGPQRIAGRGVRVVGQRVEEQVGAGVAREVLVEADARREVQAARHRCRAPSAAARRLARGGVVVLQQPQHAAVDRGEDAHPRRERRRRDLVGVVEAREHERPSSGRPCAARVVARADRALAVVGLVAVRQAHHALDVRALLAGRDRPARRRRSRPCTGAPSVPGKPR